MKTTIRGIVIVPYHLYRNRLLRGVILSLVSAGAASADPGVRYPQQQALPRLQAEIEKQKPRLSSADVEERRDAVMSLGALRNVDASRLVVPALTDPSALVRVAAASAVSSLPPDESAAALMPMLNDKDPFVRKEAAYALGGNHNRGAVAALVERLQADKDDGVRGAAAVALGVTRDEAAVVPLAQVLAPASSSAGARKRKRKENEFVLRAAAVSLGEIGSRAGVPALIETLSSDSVAEDVRREAAQSLGLIGDPSATSALQTAASGPDPHLSRIAFEALRKIALSERKTRS